MFLRMSDCQKYNYFFLFLSTNEYFVLIFVVNTQACQGFFHQGRISFFRDLRGVEAKIFSSGAKSFRPSPIFFYSSAPGV